MFRFILFLTLSSVFVHCIPAMGTNLRHYGHIVGGIDASIEEYPHQVALFIYGVMDCGGSIYSKNAVITAAHCVNNIKPKNIDVYAGTTLLSERDIKFSVSKIYVHEDYHGPSSNYDIAILIIDGNFKFNNRVQAIALSHSRPLPGTEVTTIGWGATSSGGSSPDHLQEVHVHTIDQEICKKQYSKLPLTVTPNMLCASVDEGGKDSCQGDSGGPLIVDKKLLGVVSWGYGCGLKDFPGVYASIPELRDWVLRTIRRHNAADNDN